MPGRGPQHLQARRAQVEEAIQGQRARVPGQEVQQGKFIKELNQSVEFLLHTRITVPNLKRLVPMVGLENSESHSNRLAKF